MLVPEWNNSARMRSVNVKINQVSAGIILIIVKLLIFIFQFALFRLFICSQSALRQLESRSHTQSLSMTTPPTVAAQRASQEAQKSMDSNVIMGNGMVFRRILSE